MVVSLELLQVGDEDSDPTGEALAVGAQFGGVLLELVGDVAMDAVAEGGVRFEMGRPEAELVPRGPRRRRPHLRQAEPPPRLLRRPLHLLQAAVAHRHRRPRLRLVLRLLLPSGPAFSALFFRVAA